MDQFKKRKQKLARVYYYYDRLFELREKRETITYAEIGAEQKQFYRQVPRLLGYIHVSIDVYNKLNNLKVPHIVGLVINKKTGRPGDGCHSSQHDVLRYNDYAEHKEPIRQILSFVLRPSYEYVFKEDDWTTKFCELWEAQKSQNGEQK
jgi:hypothetical protein